MHRLFDPFIRFGLNRFGTPHDGVQPVWWCKAVDAYLDRFMERRMQRFAADDEAGVGLVQEWASPSTSIDEILCWFDDTVSTAPRGLLNPTIDFVATFLIDARPEEVAATPPGATLHLSEDRLLAKWEGTRQDWWRDGRDHIAAAIRTDHQGLALVVNAASRVMIAGP